MHVHSCTILKCLDAYGGCAIVIQDIMKRVKTQNQAWLMCHLYHFLSQKQTLNVVKLGFKPVVEKFLQLITSQETLMCVQNIFIMANQVSYIQTHIQCNQVRCYKKCDQNDFLQNSEHKFHKGNLNLWLMIKKFHPLYYKTALYCQTSQVYNQI